MSDNVTADPGSGGATFATDDIGGVQFPINKITFGALDSQTLASSGSGTVDAGTQRVVLATDQPVVSIDDNGGSITVDGTVTANAGTNLNTSALALETGGNLATVAGAVSGTEMQVDVLTLPARVATTDNVGAAIQTNQMMDGTTSLTPKYAVIDDAASGDNTLIAAVSGKKIRVLQVILVSAGTVNVRFEDGAGGTALSGQINLVANTGFEASFCPIGHFETTANTLLNLELSAAVSVDGWLVYVEV